jgi:hypothetical protein
MRIQKHRRRGLAIVESAIVLPIVITVLLAIIAGAFAIFIYQQTAALAREGARYAAVHGYNYSQSSGQPSASDADIYNNAIAPHMVAMDPAHLSQAVIWAPDRRQGSYVTVTLTYQLSIPIYGDLTLTSSSTEQVHW